MAELDEVALGIAGFRANDHVFSKAICRGHWIREQRSLRANTGGPAPARPKG